MHLRPAKPSDEPSIAAICARAFLDEDLFGRVIHPYRAQYPGDVEIFWHEWIRSGWSNPRNKIIVAVAVLEGTQQEKVIGAAIWQRQGDDAGVQKMISEHTDPNPPFPALLSTHNRALDPSKKNILEDAAPFTKHYWAGSRASSWYLELCCVDPEHQGRGTGRLLVGWGLDRAAEEGVVASVTASEGSDGFYLKCGFDEVVGNASEGDGNPFKEAGVKGGNILFMWVRED